MITELVFENAFALPSPLFASWSPVLESCKSSEFDFHRSVWVRFEAGEVGKKDVVLVRHLEDQTTSIDRL